MSGGDHGLPRVILRQGFPAKPADMERIVDLWHILQGSSVDAAVIDNPSVFHFQERCLSFQSIHDPTIVQPAKIEPSLSPFEEGKIEPYYVPPLDFSRRQLDAGPGTSSVQTSFNNSSLVNDAVSRLFLDTPGPDDTSTSSGVRDVYSRIQTEEAGEAKPDLIGIIYLLDLSHSQREVSLGLALIPSARRKKFGVAATLQMLELAFDTLGYHRVSAAVLGGRCKEHALSMFVGLGFSHEGTRRRAVMSPSDAVWQDTHHLAMLDTDWSAQFFSRGTGSLRSRWDELFARHQRDQEALIGAELCECLLKRSASTETLRPIQEDLAADSGAENASEVESESSEGRSRSDHDVSQAGTNGEHGPINPFLGTGPSVYPDITNPAVSYRDYREVESDVDSDNSLVEGSKRRRILRYISELDVLRGMDPVPDMGSPLLPSVSRSSGSLSIYASPHEMESDTESDASVGNTEGDVWTQHLHTAVGTNVSERNASLHSLIFGDVPTDHPRHSFPVRDALRIPPESDTEADVSCDSESEAEQYTSAIESEGEDVLLLTSRNSRTPSHTTLSQARFYIGSLGPRGTKKRRLEDVGDTAGAGSSAGVSHTSALESNIPGPSRPFLWQSATLSDIDVPDSQPEERADADNIDLDSEPMWDIVSNASFSGFESPDSKSSLSLQSASDVEL